MSISIAPSLFISHGAPDMLLRDIAAKRFLQRLGKGLPRPKAILVISAHWSAPIATVGTAKSPETIHDFYGFPQALYRYSYPASGAPDIAKRAKVLLQKSGFETRLDNDRGLDHGAWSPLVLVYPEADIPIFQLSLLDSGDAQRHFDLGRALQPLRQEGVMILGSGAATHNLGDLNPSHGPVREPYQDFERWLVTTVENNQDEQLIAFENEGPSAKLAHPTTEHFLPLLVALGAAGDNTRPQCLHRSFDYGNLAMTCFGWDIH